MAHAISGASRSAGKAKSQRATRQLIGRSFLVVMHRWAGLFLAGFLFISGLTGAIISWDHELDEWLNPQLFKAQSEGDPVPRWCLRNNWKQLIPVYW